MAKKAKGKGNHSQNIGKEEDQILEQVLAMSLQDQKETKISYSGTC